MRTLLFFTVFTATTMAAMCPATKEESLLEAVVARNDSAVDALVKAGVDLNDTEDGRKAILRAAVNGDSAVMKKFLAIKNPRIRFTSDMWQRTPISVAALNENIQCLKLILDYINQHGDNYKDYINYALIESSKSGKIKALPLLLSQQGIDIHGAIEAATQHEQNACKELLLRKRQSMYLY